MASAGSEEYVTDVEYLRGFAADLSPVRLRLVAALNGFPQPPAEDFDYCELGSAHGDTTVALAAAYPRARFVGVDINPEHVEAARNLAAEGGVHNVRMLERDFAEMTGEDVPDFDFITAHGVLSWVGQATRKAVIDLAASKLKPGGLLYVGYNALPGWAAVEPLRRLMVDRAAASHGGSVERAREAVFLAKRLCDEGAAYFAENPAAKSMLARMEQHGLAYVVHEYMNAHWVPMYFAQVAAEMAAAGLYFVGQLPLHLNFRDLAIPTSLAGAFKDVPDRVTFESLKDYANNEFFRRDVFVKGKVQHDEAATARYLASTPFGISMGEGRLARSVRLPHHTLHFSGPIFDALFPALAAGATTLTELASVPALAPFGAARLRDAVVRLAIAGQVSPMLRPTRSAPAPAATYRVPSPYNRATLTRLSNDRPLILASDVAGTGVPLTMLEGVILRLLTEVPEPGWPAFVEAFAHHQPFRLRIADRTVEDGPEKVRIVLERIEPFRQARLPTLLELGIVERLSD